MDEFVLFALKSKKANKTNSFVYFLGESTACQSAFIWFYLTFIGLTKNSSRSIIDVILMTKTRLKWTLYWSKIEILKNAYKKTWTKIFFFFHRKCSWKFELKISPEISHIFNWWILVCTIGCVKECSLLGWPQFCKFGKSPAYFGFNFKDGFRRNDLSILWMLTPPESFLCVKNDISKDRLL
jgi:hypothetical protein